MAVVRPLLPEGYCHRVMLDAVRYVVDNGVKWANRLHDRLRDKVREREGRSPDPTAAIVDSQCVRAAANISRPTSGCDGCGEQRRETVRSLSAVLLPAPAEMVPACQR
ncbi:hypothetical protein [Streptomyces sp. NPDC058683]|uniref:hypothetical protein n=1 Tax=Streptomyces sp. NPDC058683 TaxID=3346597 RepID=UPI00364DD134